MKENIKSGESFPLASATVVSTGSTTASSATPSAGHIPATPLSKSFSKFYETVKAVRAGCPWDKDQTPLSLRSTFFEETCEAIDAITCEDSAHVKEELGDVLLNVVLIAYLFEEKGLFTVEETINSINEKLIRRHPHVFAESEGRSQVKEKVESPEGVTS
ncbi:MAG: hypothetical protein KBT11_07840, partial [Treponema sp.]|nr:hypothetical protein [Candidatus Treponema equifaecale]